MIWLYLGALLCFALIIAIALSERRRADPMAHAWGDVPSLFHLKGDKR